MDTITKNYEADNRTGLNHEGRQPNSPVERLTATSIIGDGVHTVSDAYVGKILNVIVNTERGNIEYAIVKFDPSIGSDGKLYAIPFTAMSVDPQRKLFLIDADINRLKSAPGFDESTIPNNADAYFSDVNTFYAAMLA